MRWRIFPAKKGTKQATADKIKWFTRLSPIERAEWNALEDTVNDSLSGVIWLDSFTYQFSISYSRSSV